MKQTIILLIQFFTSGLLLFAPPVSAADQTAVMRFLVGWNLYAIPYKISGSELTASNWIANMNLKGGNVTTIARFENGRWEEYVKRENGEIYGFDFPIELGKAYFVRTTREFKYAVAGQIAPGGTVNLVPGYNFISLPGFTKADYKFSDFSKELGHDEVLMAKFKSGLFESFLFRNGASYGTNFALDGYAGYAVRVNESGIFRY